MAKYHLRDNGEPGKCVAQPGNCEYGSKDDPEFNHYDSPDAARVAFEQQQESSVQKPLSARKVYAAKAVNRALTAPLSYDGKNPQWMVDNIEEGSEMWGNAWGAARIVDVMDSPVGELAVVWTPRSIRDVDVAVQENRGFMVRELGLFSMETGEHYAHVSVGNVTTESIEYSWGDDDWTAFRYIERDTGKRCGVSAYKELPVDHPLNRNKKTTPVRVDLFELASTDEEILEAKKKVWINAHEALGITPKNKVERETYSWDRSLNEDSLPASEKLIDEDLSVLRKIAEKDLSAHKKDRVEPFVDSSKVNDDVVGTGLGSAMYIYAGRMLAENNEYLRGSSVQSDEALELWGRFEANPDIPTIRVKKKWTDEEEAKEYIALDFRNP